MAESPAGEVLLYETPDGAVRVDDDTVWLTQRQTAELFDTAIENVVVHLKNIFADNELDERATTTEYLVVQSEGTRSVRRRIKNYSLDAIISIGYRVSSRRAVRFRQWATSTLR